MELEKEWKDISKCLYAAWIPSKHPELLQCAYLSGLSQRHYFYLCEIKRGRER